MAQKLAPAEKNSTDISAAFCISGFFVELQQMYCESVKLKEKSRFLVLRSYLERSLLLFFIHALNWTHQWPDSCLLLTDNMEKIHIFGFFFSFTINYRNQPAFYSVFKQYMKIYQIYAGLQPNPSLMGTLNVHQYDEFSHLYNVYTIHQAKPH